MPRRCMACGPAPVTGAPLKNISPCVGLSAPLIRLNKVLLPAPLGPMIDVIWPRIASKCNAFTAVNPPKRTERSRTATIGPSFVMAQAPCADEADDARWQQNDREHEGYADDDQVMLRN